MLYEDNYLAHFGIKGQKWGVRRFQNEDGSYTQEGKERYKRSPQHRENQLKETSSDKYFNNDGSFTESGRRHFSSRAFKEWTKLKEQEDKYFRMMRENRQTADDIDYYKEQIERGRKEMRGWKERAEYILNTKVPVVEEANKAYDHGHNSMLSVESELYDLTAQYEDHQSDYSDISNAESASKYKKEIDKIIQNDPRVKELVRKEEKISDAYDEKAKSKKFDKEANDLLMQLFSASDDKREAELWAAYSYAMSKYPKKKAVYILANWFSGGDWAPV